MEVPMSPTEIMYTDYGTTPPNKLTTRADQEEEDMMFEPRKILKKASSERHDVSHLLKVNMCYALPYMLMYGLGTWYCAFAISGNGATTSVFEAKFGWTEDETILYNTIISSAGIVGLTLGSFIGGPMISNGRRKGAIIANLICIFGACICMVGNTAFLTAGRVFVGIAAGIYNVVFGKCVVENVPIDYA